MQIRNAVGLFYAVHILKQNNFSALMIEIDRQLFNGKKKVFPKRLYDFGCLEQNTRNLLTSRGWERMKNNFQRDQMKYYRLRRNLLHALNLISLGILAGSKTFQSFLRKQNQNFILDKFEQMENIQGICDQIDWNVLDPSSTIHLLRISSVSNRTVCSLNTVQSDSKYQHICEYGL